MGWPSPHLAGSDVLSVEAGMSDTTKNTCLTGVANSYVLFQRLK